MALTRSERAGVVALLHLLRNKSIPTAIWLWWQRPISGLMALPD